MERSKYEEQSLYIIYKFFGQEILLLWFLEDILL
jgi:hypothetical protein